MSFFNTSFVLEEKAEVLWLTWMKSIFLSMLQDALPNQKFWFTRLKSSSSNSGITYSLLIQYKSMDELERVEKAVLKQLYPIMDKKFKNLCYRFCSYLEEV